MTPLEFAKSLAADLQMSYGAQLPAPFTAQLGDLVLDCQGTFVSILSLSEQDVSGGNANCDPVEMADVVVAVTRECANVALDDGTTNRPAMDLVSAGMDHDALLLREAADKWFMRSAFRLGRPTVSFAIQGAMANVIMNVSLAVP